MDSSNYVEIEVPIKREPLDLDDGEHRVHEEYAKVRIKQEETGSQHESDNGLNTCLMIKESPKSEQSDNEDANVWINHEDTDSQPESENEAENDLDTSMMIMERRRKVSDNDFIYELPIQTNTMEQEGGENSHDKHVIKKKKKTTKPKKKNWTDEEIATERQKWDREFKPRKALLKHQSKQQQDPDSIVAIATEDIRSAGPSKDIKGLGPSEIRTLEKRAKSAEATRRWREKKRGGRSKKQAKTAAQRMREYRERKKLTKKILLKQQSDQHKDSKDPKRKTRQRIRKTQKELSEKSTDN